MKSNSFSKSVTLNIKSQATGISVPLSSNEDGNSEFYFLNQISTSSLYPFSKGHKINGIGSLNDQVSLKVSSDILTTRGLFGQYESDNDGILYSKAEYVTTNKNTVQCNIDKKTFNKVVEILKISLWINATGNSNFTLTSDSQLYLFIRELLFWNSTKVLNQISILTSKNFDYTIPTNGNFNYQLNMTPIVNSTSTTSIDCDYTTEINPLCNFKQKNLDTITSFPSHLNFTFYIYHKTSGLVSSGFEVNYLTYYYSNMTIERLKPFLISFYERKNKPVKIISNVKNQLNFDRFKFKCNITLEEKESILSDVSFDIKESEIQTNISESNHFSCLFSTFGTPFTTTTTFVYKLKLLFVSELEDIELTPNEALISALFKTPPINPTVGFSEGNFLVALIYRAYSLPTSEFTSYVFSMGTYVTGTYVPLDSCSEEELNIYCTFPNVHQNYSSWDSTRRFIVDLRISNVHSMNLFPFMTIYPTISVKSIQPSIYLPTKSRTKINLLVSEIEYVGQDFAFRIVQGNKKVTDICVIGTSTSITCNIPLINDPGTYSLLISIDNTNFQSLNTEIEFFDESSILINKTSTTEISFIKKTELFIEGNNFFNSSDILVSLFDNFVYRISKGYYINSTHIKTTILPFYDINIEFPRKLSLRVSFNAGANYKNSKTAFTIEKQSKFSTSPSIISSRVKTKGIKMTGLPINEMYINATESLGFLHHC